MDRTVLAQSDEEIAAEFGRVLMLFQQSFSKVPNRRLLQSLMKQASGRGLTWVDALESIVKSR